MNQTRLKYVSNNPAASFQRIVCVGRRMPNESENQLLEREFEQLKKPVVGFMEDFNHRERELDEAIRKDWKEIPVKSTAYALFSNDTFSSGAIVAAKTCEDLDAPIILFVHHGDELDSLDVIYQNQRYSASVQAQTMTSGA